MKVKQYKYGTFYFRAYEKEVGHGYEVGILHQGKPLFVSNFISRFEALQWWSHMNQNIKKFIKTYWIGKAIPHWYKKFFSHYIYNHYYGYLKTPLTRHNNNFKKAKRVLHTSQ